MHSAIEKELLKATGFKPKKYKNRQDLLAAIAKAGSKLSDDEFEELSSEAADWMNEAAGAVKDEEDIPDFKDTEDEESEDDDDDDDDDDDKKSSKKSKKSKKGKKSSKDDDDEDEEEDDDDDKKSSKKGKKGKKGKKSSSSGTDRFGVRIGTKVHEAVKMFEKGASMKDVREETGGNRYVILQNLADEGHRVEHLEGLIKLTHKDDLKGGKKGGKIKEEAPPKKSSKSEKSSKKSKRRDDDDDDDDDDREERKSKKDKKGKKGRKVKRK